MMAGHTGGSWLVRTEVRQEFSSRVLTASGGKQQGSVGRQVAGRGGMFLHVGDFDTAYERMVAAGVQFVSPISARSAFTRPSVPGRRREARIEKQSARLVVAKIEENDGLEMSRGVVVKDGRRPIISRIDGSHCPSVKPDLVAARQRGQDTEVAGDRCVVELDDSVVVARLGHLVLHADLPQEFLSDRRHRALRVSRNVIHDNLTWLTIKSSAPSVIGVD
jgi:hypothetical protein